jgi:APA family basic amino acid/polyamine antiporter
MVGVGIFTTTGYQVRDLGSLQAVLASWVVGGLAAVCGALAYAELAAALPENGGEYRLLTRIYHPGVGFVCGWVSFIAGFSAPIGANAIAFADYLARALPGTPRLPAALALIVAMTGVHAARVTVGGRVQDLFTAGKVLLIVLFSVAGFAGGEPSRLLESNSPPIGTAMLSPAFAVGLVYVSYAYLGWNAAVYVAGEVERPERGVPLASVAGTLIVMLLYVGLNVVYLSAAPAAELAGRVEVAEVAARHLFGAGAGRLVAALIAAGLVSNVGALVMTGARIYEAMGRDYPKLALLARRRSGGGPLVATAVQAAVAILTVLTASYDAVIVYVGFVLALFTALTVVGLFVLRVREPDLPRPYRAWGHPVTTGAFILLMAWMLLFAVAERPSITLVGLGTVLVGWILYEIVRPRP